MYLLRDSMLAVSQNPVELLVSGRQGCVSARAGVAVTVIVVVPAGEHVPELDAHVVAVFGGWWWFWSAINDLDGWGFESMSSQLVQIGGCW
jgi:hypothetical protein